MSKFNRLVVGSLAALSAVTAAAGGGPADIGSWEWTVVNDDAAWVRRAGLKVVELNDSFYLMGGRTSRPPTFPPIPGDSDIWGDVWKSDDHGASWTEILATEEPGHWSPRGYFGAVTRGDYMYVMGGQDFAVIENPDCPPPYVDCLPFLSVSQFFADVWRSSDGINWELLTDDAGWAPRAGLSAIVYHDEFYVVGGSFLDDPVFGGPPVRVYFNDVWKSADGITWEQVAPNPPFEPRAGAVLVVKDDFIYLLGGEDGFVCQPVPCEPPYFNDVWRTEDGADWELVTESADWSPRPGHQAAVVEDRIVLFGGFDQSQNPDEPFAPSNPMDVWVSEDGFAWEQVSDSPWNAVAPEEIKFDFAALATEIEVGCRTRPAIFTFGGDRETFDFTDPFNYLEMDNDVWQFSADTCPADLNDTGYVGRWDLCLLIQAWGYCDGCPEDLNGSGYVGWYDLWILINSWGWCP